MPDYPPEFDEPELCLVCGLDLWSPVTDCVCPECPVCAEVGNPDCYRDGHLVADPDRTYAEVETALDRVYGSPPGDDERGDTVVIWIIVLAVIWIPALFFIGAVVFLNLAR